MSRLLASAGEQFGTIVRTRRAGDLVFRLSRYPARLHLPAHHHRGAYFSFVARGWLAERRGRTHAEFAPGSVHFHPAEESHAGDTGPDGLLCLSIVPEAGLWNAAAHVSPQSYASLDGLAARCYRAFRDDDDPSTLCLEAGGLELLAALPRSPDATRCAPRAAWIGAVREHLRRHYARSVSLAELSELAGVHRVHLVRGFRRALGITPGAFQRQLRLEHARRALAGSNQPIVDIALETGFASQSHLTRWFHRMWGLPPQAYRRARRRGPS